LLENDIVRKVDAHQNHPTWSCFTLASMHYLTDDPLMKLQLAIAIWRKLIVPHGKPCVKPLSDFPTCSRNKPNHFSGRNLAAIPSYLGVASELAHLVSPTWRALDSGITSGNLPSEHFWLLRPPISLVVDS